MIGEFLRYWTTPAPERVRTYGYLQRLIAIEYRERRCRAAWGPHLAQTRQYIVKAMDVVPRPRTAVILGSGLLLDVPLEDLSERFETVYLADIFHMPRVRRIVRGYDNVRLLTGDVTGIFRAMKEGKTPDARTPAPPARIPHIADADLIVSCNCLTQLAGPFNDLFRRTQGFTDADCDLLSVQVMENHLKALVDQAVGVSVVITDTQRIAVRDGKIVGRKDLLRSLKLPHAPHPQHDQEWEWLIAPAGEERPSLDIRHMISARIYERPLPEEMAAAATARANAAVTEELPTADGLADTAPAS